MRITTWQNAFLGSVQLFKKFSTFHKRSIHNVMALDTVTGGCSPPPHTSTTNIYFSVIFLVVSSFQGVVINVYKYLPCILFKLLFRPSYYRVLNTPFSLFTTSVTTTKGENKFN